MKDEQFPSPAIPSLITIFLQGNYRDGRCSSRCTRCLSSPPTSRYWDGIALKAFHKVCHRHHFGRLCCNMQWVCILADKMQSIVMGIGAVRFHSCLCFLCGLPLSHCLAGPGDWSWFWLQRHGFERSCYFRAKSLAKISGGRYIDGR